MHSNVVADLFIFLLDRIMRNAQQIRRQIECFFDRSSAKLYTAKLLLGVCVSVHCIHLRTNVSPLIIWLSPASLHHKGIPQSVCAIYCQGPQIQIDPDRQADRSLILIRKIQKLEVMVENATASFFPVQNIM